MSTEIFDEVLAETQPVNTDATDAAPTAEAGEENASEWPKTLTLPAGERPENSDTVAEFADRVNKAAVAKRVAELLADGVSALDAAMEAMTVQISQASFYQAVKGQRNPMPHYVVTYETQDTDENGAPVGEVKREEKVFVPVDVALEWWENRPTRGVGGGRSSSEEELAKRLLRAGKKVTALRDAEARLTKLQANIERMKGQVEKYEGQLKADNKTLSDAVAAYEAELEKGEEASAISDED